MLYCKAKSKNAEEEVLGKWGEGSTANLHPKIILKLEDYG